MVLVRFGAESTFLCCYLFVSSSIISVSNCVRCDFGKLKFYEFLLRVSVYQKEIVVSRNL